MQGENVTFTITEVLKGDTHSALHLERTPGMGEIFKVGEEYILCWEGENSEKGIVCSSMFFGVPEWLCITVHRDGQKITVDGVGSLEQAKAICASKSK